LAASLIALNTAQATPMTAPAIGHSKVTPTITAAAAN